MIRVLVTGASGYIAGRLIKAMAGKPSIIVTGSGRGTVSPIDGVRTIVLDWSPASIAAACRDQDLVIHLAAMNEPDSERDPEAALRCNGQYTASLVQSALSCGVQRFIYVSTSKVFGNNPNGSIDERTLPRPTSPYAITHRVAEDYVLAAHRTGRLEGAVLRLSNAFGAPANTGAAPWTLVANDFCRQAMNDRRIILKSSGMAWRNFIGMTGVVRALCHIAEIPKSKIGDGLFHLGGRESTRILEMAEMVGARAQRILGRKIEITRAMADPAERHEKLDWKVDKLANTGWVADQNFDIEIDETLRFFANTAQVGN